MLHDIAKVVSTFSKCYPHGIKQVAKEEYRVKEAFRISAVEEVTFLEKDSCPRLGFNI